MYQEQVISGPPFKSKSFQAIMRVFRLKLGQRGSRVTSSTSFPVFFPTNAHKLTTVCNTINWFYTTPYPLAVVCRFYSPSPLHLLPVLRACAEPQAGVSPPRRSPPGIYLYFWNFPIFRKWILTAIFGNACLKNYEANLGFEATRFHVLHTLGSTKSATFVMKSKRGELVRGSDAPSRTVLTIRPAICSGTQPGVCWKYSWRLKCRK